jgi:superfamily II DNA/RNA helicase
MKTTKLNSHILARGLDIAEIQNVVNFDVARDIDTHVSLIAKINAV